MLVIGIDPGTAITGYGLVREQQLYQELKQITLLHRPDSGAVEKLFFQKNVRTAISVGQGRGVAILALAEAGISIGEYTPLEIKQSIAGYGGADKAQVQYMVKALLELDEIPHPDDAADALAVAICHIHYARFNALTETQA
jgi:crossover junction endodeoxyribonuclease RuvC